jgi:hypothetical protein
MKRNLLLAAMVAFLGVGCGVANPDDQAADTIEDDTKADAVFPAGRFEADHPHLGQIAYVVLNSSNHTFERAIQMVDCIPIQSCGPEKGTYKFSASGSTHYIRFLDNKGVLLDRYAWKLSGSTLSLRPEHDSTWEHLTKQTKTQDAQLGESCGGFVANPRHCAPGLTCQGNRIPDLPGTCVVDAASNPCEAAGGSCVALYPGACNTGNIGDARKYSCGAGLGIECCLPPPASQPECVTANDCPGFLPQFCKVCSDGTSQCAHWTCDAGKCAVATCQ